MLALEAIGVDRMYVWYAYFGVTDCNNDLNVLDGYPLHQNFSFREYLPPLTYELNGSAPRCPYQFLDYIYRQFPYYLQIILDLNTTIKKERSQCRESR